mmetsp:Transcript_19735/g.19845  ORF Transcript_19735/g.19845 Transcript_19735/m.19845 type:complete len:192 (+) Transcript_19735:77-652(+)
MSNMKEAARELQEKADARNVRFPKIWDEKKRIQDCGATIMMHKSEDGTFDIEASLNALIEKYGVEEVPATETKKRKKDIDSTEVNKENDENDSPQKDTKKAKAIHLNCEENRPVALAIQEIAGMYFKNGDARKGGVFSKAAKAIRECETKITNSKEAIKLKGVGKGIAGYVEEYLTTGCISKLEELRAGTA